MFDQLAAWLTAPIPAWLALCLLVACGALFWQLRAVIRRLDNHAESIAHMDAWADVMDERMERVDWIKMHQSAANDRRRKVRKAG